MCKQLYLLIIIILMSSNVLGKNGNKEKNIKNGNENANKKDGKLINERGKRSVDDIQKAFFTRIGQRLKNKNLDGLAKYASEELISNLEENNVENEPPFWGTRGRRDSASESKEHFSTQNKEVKCTTCTKRLIDFYRNEVKEELDPFWFERGVKDKSKEFNIFWDDRNERDEMEPFWGNRGRRDEIEPFWGNRGRRDEIDPFWGNRGKKNEMEAFWENQNKRDEDDPFWGNRGRRDEAEPFWGNRGKRQENEPFWGTRGRRDTQNSLRRNFYSSNQAKMKTALKENLINVMDNIEYGIENLARMRRTKDKSFWNNRGRDSKLENLFKQQARHRNPFQIYPLTGKKLSNRPAEQNTILDERMYAEQPHYILIERSSRSSAEEDPFYISRGKKFTKSKLSKGFRDRRGVLEELVKSVRNDPYYIARGKKDMESTKIANSTIIKNDFVKAKELICSTVDLLGVKNDNDKMKRNVDESERERRTILKKLAAQLQMDPYFVSRGKKNDESDLQAELSKEFINNVSNMCN